jgi:glyoxylase-like metal-dependent hydrolase (beta-lactamase superfamily II)
MENVFEDRTLPVTSVSSGAGTEAAPDVYVYTNQVVNLMMAGDAAGWVLVDAGMPNSHEEIIAEAESRFGENARPQAIILTHGHFDHVGSIVELVRHWDVFVYAHERELPYLNGTRDYPPADPTVEGGLVAKMSLMFPHEGIDLGAHLSILPADGAVPGMPGWQWIFTPGHSPGHVSLFRESDRTLIAGDAFVTVEQESLYKVFTQKKEIHGPPRYFTTDWEAARESVRRLNGLRPAYAITGHGHPVSGDDLADGLDRLAREFDRLAVPDHGRYVN